jgi:hypothetical protein|tara:strand:+ start:131 stop:433 length:303 start_codon:yes stop_codon:yes gene_type:complete
VVDESVKWGIGTGLAALGGILGWAFSVERRLGKVNGTSHMQDEINGHTRALSKDRAEIAGISATVQANTRSIERMETALGMHMHEEEQTLGRILGKLESL